MKKINIILFIIITVITQNAYTEMLTLDKLDNPGKTMQNQTWSFVTDGVMGGLSEGAAKLDKIDNVPCYRMIGNVTTENNGGFIQIMTKMSPSINISDYKGIYLKVFGNNKKYYIFVRTPLTIAPWQYYSFDFISPNKWQEIKAPFLEFEKSNFYQPKKLSNQKIKSIGLVAAFDNFQSDICLGEIGLY